MGTTMFILFLIAAVFGAYSYFRRQSTPIGHVGVVTFLGTRTNRIFGEGLYVLPFFCTVVEENLMDQKIVLALEDTATADGVDIIFKNPFLRYRLKQLPKERGSTSRFSLPFIRRFIPFRMDDTLAEYLNVRIILDDNIRATAQGAISTSVAATPHADILGYHVIRIVDQLLSSATIETTFEKTKVLTSRVMETRLQLQAVIKQTIESQFANAGIEVMNISFPDIDPTTRDKEYINNAIQAVQKQQLDKIKTSMEVVRALVVAEAIGKFAKDHPNIDLETIYKMMRNLDILQSAADGSSFFGLIAQALYAKLKPEEPATVATSVSA